MFSDAIDLFICALLLVKVKRDVKASENMLLLRPLRFVIETMLYHNVVSYS